MAMVLHVILTAIDIGTGCWICYRGELYTLGALSWMSRMNSVFCFGCGGLDGYRVTGWRMTPMYWRCGHISPISLPGHETYLVRVVHFLDVRRTLQTGIIPMLDIFTEAISSTW